MERRCFTFRPDSILTDFPDNFCRTLSLKEVSAHHPEGGRGARHSPWRTIGPNRGLSIPSLKSIPCCFKNRNCFGPATAWHGDVTGRRRRQDKWTRFSSISGASWLCLFLINRDGSCLIKTAIRSWQKTEVKLVESFHLFWKHSFIPNNSEPLFSTVLYIYKIWWW